MFLSKVEKNEQTRARDQWKNSQGQWISSVCSMCYGGCSIKVKVVDGVVRKIEGNPDSPLGSGRLCAKGTSAIMTLYDPNRINYPLKRTNPEKGVGINPGWKRISWEEAMTMVAEKLKKVYQDDPRKLFTMGTTTCASALRNSVRSFSVAFGSPNYFAGGGGLHCGNGAHQVAGVTHASWSIVPDFDYCNYVIYFGASKGHGAGHAANANAQLAADARSRGMKMVVVDPLSFQGAGAKATEWVPIKPGTDAALALAMLNVLINELGIFDAEYLKYKSNAAYLIGPDGKCVRDTASGKPLVWDTAAGESKTYDAPNGDLALEGRYEVNGTNCRPAFELLKEHVQKYSPEKAEKITTIPARTIRKIAREFGEAARIGSKIVIDGKELPYRPVSAIYFRGSQGHKNSLYNCIAIDTLNHVVGAADLPGGTLGFCPAGLGHPETGRPAFYPKVGLDGLMMTGIWQNPHSPYPLREAAKPRSMGLVEMFPLALASPFMASSDQEEVWGKIGLSYRPEMILNFGCNSVMSAGNAGTVIETLKKIPFIVVSELYLNEFTEFADIVLPDTCYLERLESAPNHPPILNHPAGMGQWGWPIRQPIIKPLYERRDFAEVLLELSKKIGIVDNFYAVLNLMQDIQQPYRLEADGDYTWEEICDRQLKSHFGEKRGLEWFKEHGMITWPKKVEEVYWRAFTDARVPIYWEFILTAGEQVEPLAKEFGIDFDPSYYQALPEYLPCVSHEVMDPEFDLIGIYYRDVQHTNSFTMQNAWLDEVSMKDAYVYSITLNNKVATKKGIKDGDQIYLESVVGRKVLGKANLSEAIHPEVVAVAGCSGHWADGLPIAKGKGTFFNELLEIDYKHSSPANLNLDTCVKLKVYPAATGQKGGVNHA